MGGTSELSDGEAEKPLTDPRALVGDWDLSFTSPVEGPMAPTLRVLSIEGGFACEWQSDTGREAHCNGPRQKESLFGFQIVYAHEGQQVAVVLAATFSGNQLKGNLGTPVGAIAVEGTRRVIEASGSSPIETERPRSEPAAAGPSAGDP
jgi:hypothetical protein